jgi:hypothetical protein
MKVVTLLLEPLPSHRCKHRLYLGAYIDAALAEDALVRIPIREGEETSSGISFFLVFAYILSRTPISKAMVWSSQFPFRSQLSSPGMIRQQEFQVGLSGLEDPRRVGGDLHIGVTSGRRIDQSLGPLDLDDADTAGSVVRNPLKIAEGRNFHARLLAGVKNGCPLFDLKGFAVYGYSYLFGTHPIPLTLFPDIAAQAAEAS